MVSFTKIKQRFGQSFRHLRNDASYFLGNRHQSPQSGSRILVYHGIDLADSRRYNTKFISQKRLSAHIEQFKKYFKIVPLEEIFQGKACSEFKLALSFDDGYENNLKYALPVLRHHGVPATYCITGVTDTEDPILWADYLDIIARESGRQLTIDGITYKSKKIRPWGFYSYVDPSGLHLKSKALASGQQFKQKLMAELRTCMNLAQLAPYQDYWCQLKRHQIEQLSQHSYINIVSHGYHHDSLANISFESACTDMLKSKLFLENIIQKPIDSFAYPDGSYTNKLVQHGKSIGYQYQLITGYQSDKDKNDPIIYDRLTINPYISAHNQILAIIEGNYHGRISN